MIWNDWKIVRQNTYVNANFQKEIIKMATVEISCKRARALIEKDGKT